MSSRNSRFCHPIALHSRRDDLLPAKYKTRPASKAAAPVQEPDDSGPQAEPLKTYRRRAKFFGRIFGRLPLAVKPYGGEK